MPLDVSSTQQKRLDKIARLRRYFGPEDRPEIYEWDSATDEGLAWKDMTDDDVAKHLMPGS